MQALSFIIAYCYVFLTILDYSFIHEGAYYNRILKRPELFYHLAGSVALAVLGYYRCRYVNYIEGSFFVPLVYLVMLLIVNPISRFFLGRNIYIIVGRGIRPEGYNWYIDGILGFILFIIVVLTPFVLYFYFESLDAVRISPAH